MFPNTKKLPWIFMPRETKLIVIFIKNKVVTDYINVGAKFLLASGTFEKNKMVIEAYCIFFNNFTLAAKALIGGYICWCVSIIRILFNAAFLF